MEHIYIYQYDDVVYDCGHLLHAASVMKMLTQVYHHYVGN